MAKSRGAGLIAAAAAAKAAASRPAAEAPAQPVQTAQEPQATPPAPEPPVAEPETVEYVTTAIHVPKDTLALLRRVAVERANIHGGRPSVSAVLTDLVQANWPDLEAEAERRR
ncbi:hypothetical protein BSA145_21365 (plasmid) [Bacillus safensis]|uniref:Uncharacterized protein n=1 Tax=Bacillus safensis TaxID=561879 RepID=A0A1L6ZPH2_BACIA|nr:hypothetical protein [Bacillus safensis]APT48417.1 hypothetical protein BSA145_21365 [Bacillus safensis]